MLFKKAVKFILSKLEKELPPGHLSYHNINHIRDVYQAAEMIGGAEGINEYEMQLLLTAASLHDAGFMEKATGHEDISCRMARKILPNFEYSEYDIDKICSMIMTTRIPQLPQNHLEQVLADADLDYLGRDDFFATGRLLYNEMLATGIIANYDEWNKMQVRFMEDHHYFTKTSVNLRSAKKEENLKQVKTALNL